MVVVEKTVRYFALDSEGKPKAKALTKQWPNILQNPKKIAIRGYKFGDSL